MHIAIVGGGWAGLSAAVRAVTAGHQVTLMEMSARLGGRARTVEQHGMRLDNGQHILIGAYRDTLALLRQLGVDPDAVFLRQPLSLVTPDGSGLAVPSPSSPAGLIWSVLRHSSWPWSSRLTLLRACARWAARGFDCPSHWTVRTLTQDLPERVRDELIDPLCVSALNTFAQTASAQVFLRVLKDALMQEKGGADLLLPRAPLSELLPAPALDWLQRHGAAVRLGHRVGTLELQQGQWHIGGNAFDHVVLACTAAEAARLTCQVNPAWSLMAQQLPQSAITTIYLLCRGAKLRSPMVFLPDGPAQFAFDHGALGMEPGRFAFVISASEACSDKSNAQWAHAVLEQARAQFPSSTWPGELQVQSVFTERRATFRCSPDVVRPPPGIAAGLSAAGDYVLGPYPSTLEGAVRSGQAAIEALA